MAHIPFGNLLENAQARWIIDDQGNILGIAAFPIATSLTVGGSPIGENNPVPVELSNLSQSKVVIQGIERQTLTYQDVRLDASTLTMQTIDYSHHEIHSGSFFYVHGQTEITGAGTNFDFLWSVPNNAKWPHAQWNIAGEAEFTMSLYEGVTTSNDGTPITIFNANRNSTKVPGVKGYSGPTLAGGALGDGGQGGTLIWQGKIGSARSATVGRGASGYEIVAKQNTKYWFRFTLVPAGTFWIAYDFNWYEHQDAIPF